MSQPKWKCVATLGDVNMLEYGGALVLVDETGVYPPELEIVSGVEDEEFGEDRHEIHRICCHQCFLTDGVLSDNKYHKDEAAWFSEYAMTDGEVDGASLIEQLCSDDPIERARGYYELTQYYGAHEFDHYPMRLRPREAHIRYRHLPEFVGTDPGEQAVSVTEIDKVAKELKEKIARDEQAVAREEKRMEEDDENYYMLRWYIGRVSAYQDALKLVQDILPHSICAPEDSPAYS